MSTRCSRKWAEEPSTQAVGEDEPLQGLTSGELTDPPQTSVDPQQSSEVLALEHLGNQNVRVHSPQTVPVQVQSPIGAAGAADSGHNLDGAPEESDHVSPDEGGTENTDGSFSIRASELGRLRKEYADLMNLKENGEIVLVEAMEATEQLNTVQ
ncbi:hypothetical protein M422DRAFT_270167 [Sphaerobolus stellatus SS14]|uniref:Unplaced genomic scaffold SPHSTscaffold_228, whole genome shotgun sequence n=1 Tax=Sphaerobolus stellatus (strain SS14) TaxID=990650 RepID=A0A0C9U2Z1_SPHS4|nr:hypothetical protein M422DRAFT_270167 [Sphaerobolus stellatus SS14]